MPQIIHVITDKNAGGAGLLLLQLLRHIDREKYPSAVLLPAGSALIPLLAREKIPILPVSGAEEASLSFSDVPFFLRFFRAHPCDILQTHGCFSARVAGKAAGIPVLLNTLHCDVRQRRDRLFTPLYRTFTTLTVAVSRNAEEGLFLRGIPQKEITRIENGFCPISPPDEAERSMARARLGVPPGCLAVGLAARFVPVKGHRSLLYATKKAVDSGANIHLFLTGEGEEKEGTAILAGTLGLTGRVHFPGFLADMTAFYHAMDIHLSCSLGSETASLSLAEGMSAALPTIASSCAGNRQRVGTGGMLYPPGDAAALARCLLRMTNPDVRADYACRARFRAAQLPTGAGMARSYEALYHALCPDAP